LIQTASTTILVDSGFSLRRMRERAAQGGVTLDAVQAVFITHEHSDHVNGLGVLARDRKIPVYLTEGTYNHLPEKVGALPKVELFEAGDTIRVGDIEVGTFSVSHDAADPVNYTFRCGAAKLGFATDIGQVSTLVRTRLSGSHALVLESNYCPVMLRNGPYPAQVQQRIRGHQGHMSNQDMSSLLDHLLHDGLKVVVLVHLSENNNDPRKAEEMASLVLKGHGTRLHVAAQDTPSPFFEVRA
jgi:phosphoribosyl 1,2-cyclic phosphodiesterase